LEALGARPQRPLWASTGVKDPSYDDTRYVVELVAPGTVNTMPEGTLRAVDDHGTVRGNTIGCSYAEAQQVFDDLTEVGVDLDDVFQALELDGVAKFQASWRELHADVAQALGVEQPS
jgi:transaldolase